MSDEASVDVQHDDAPPATSKHQPADAAATGLTDAKGGKVSAQATTIGKPVSEVYARFRDFARLPDFMENLERIDVLDEKRSHWVVKAPGNTSVEWDAIVTEDVPDKLIAWTSGEGADIANSGRVTFRDAGERGTVVTATILYDPPGGALGKLVAKLFQREPSLQSRRDLARFKQLLETGEIATSANTAEQFEKNGGR